MNVQASSVSIVRILTIVWTAVALCACGQKGALTLPPSATAAPAPHIAAPAPGSAASTPLARPAPTRTP